MGQHPFGGSNPVLPEWSLTNVLSFARMNVISARIGGSTDPLTPRPVRLGLLVGPTYQALLLLWFKAGAPRTEHYQLVRTLLGGHTKHCTQQNTTEYNSTQQNTTAHNRIQQHTTAHNRMQLHTTCRTHVRTYAGGSTSI